MLYTVQDAEDTNLKQLEKWYTLALERCRQEDQELVANFGSTKAANQA